MAGDDTTLVLIPMKKSRKKWKGECNNKFLCSFCIRRQGEECKAKNDLYASSILQKKNTTISVTESVRPLLSNHLLDANVPLGTVHLTSMDYYPLILIGGQYLNFYRVGDLFFLAQHTFH